MISQSNPLSPLSIPDALHLFSVLINDPSLPKLIWHPHRPSTSKCSKQGSFSVDCSFRHFFPQPKNPITSVPQHVILFWFYFSDYSLWPEKKKCFNLRYRACKGLWGWVHNLQLHKVSVHGYVCIFWIYRFLSVSHNWQFSKTQAIIL